MKKRFVVALMVVLTTSLFSSRCLLAMPSDADSNTAQMKGEWVQFPLATGASADFVERDLDNNEELNSTHWYGANIYFDPVERLHFNLFLGAVQGDLDNLRLVLSTGVPVPNVVGLGDSDTAFAIGISSKADVVEFNLVPNQPNAQLFVSGGFRYAEPDLNSARGSNGLQPTALNMKVGLSEWQAGGGIQQPLENIIAGVVFAPYIGVKYSDMNVDLSGTSSFPAGPGVTVSIVTGERKSDEVVGLFLGLQILGWENRLSFDVEGRFIDESAVYINGRMRW